MSEPSPNSSVTDFTQAASSGTLILCTSLMRSARGGWLRDDSLPCWACEWRRSATEPVLRQDGVATCGSCIGGGGGICKTLGEVVDRTSGTGIESTGGAQVGASSPDTSDPQVPEGDRMCCGKGDPMRSLVPWRASSKDKEELLLPLVRSTGREHPTESVCRLRRTEANLRASVCCSPPGWW
eukprot:scaffold249325_cov30-Tisochrysis_lutea.AAC.7